MPPSGTDLGRRAALALMGSAALGIAFSTAAQAEPLVVEGRVVYRERMLLPNDSVLTVRLDDVSLADAPSVVIAATSVPATTSPTSFALHLDDAVFMPGHRYAVRAEIRHGGQLIFVTDTHHAYEPGTSGPVEIMVVRASRADAAAGSIEGNWLAEDILGGGVIDRLQTTLTVAADGAVSGSGGCNRFRGTATIDGEAVRFSQMAGTLMACTEAAMNQESRFHEALEATRSFRVDVEQRKLFLIDEGGAEVARLSAMD